ncbi:MAG: hypothetical protein ABI351_02375 [Herbaspirillum sp.]
MASTTTQTSIANRALQLLGYQSIGSINDNDRGARAVNRAYYSVLYSELRANFWNFSIKRAILSAAATQPLFGKNNYFILPPDFLDLAMPDQITTYNYGAVPNVPNLPAVSQDFTIEAYDDSTVAIASNMDSPLYIRYVSSSIKEAIFDVCFAEALSASLAIEICEELTQNSTKIQTAAKMYDDAIEKAKKRNAFEMRPVESPVDRYITVRL